MAVWTEDTPDRGQVRVETGTGLITDLKHEAGKRNAQLKIKATHTNLRDDVTGWVDTADSAVWPVAQEAAAEHFEIEYRIEVHRKTDVDKTKPISELGNREKVRDVAALARKGELSQLDRTPPTASTSAADVDTEPQPPQRRPRVQEAKPWELYNTDRSLNLASYSYRAAAEFVELAHRLTIDHLNDLADREDAPEFRMPKVETLARTLLDAADQVQARTRADGHVDRMDDSHTRARYAIRTALTLHPIPWDADQPVRATWLEHLTDHAADILGVALNLFRFHETGERR